MCSRQEWRTQNADSKAETLLKRQLYCWHQETQNWNGSRRWLSWWLHRWRRGCHRCLSGWLIWWTDVSPEPPVVTAERALPFPQWTRGSTGATPIQGVGTGAGVSWVMAALTLRAGTGTKNSGTGGASAGLGARAGNSLALAPPHLGN